jgi:hypothetical protein
MKTSQILPIFLPVMTIPFKMSHTVWEKHSTGKRAPESTPGIASGKRMGGTGGGENNNLKRENRVANQKVFG